ncbi:hypothetical protein GQ53DRAFT_770185 [Thozetella sp. PMI_491]|nr:hypothetical protein GQ53DRAFT_770185 [Thozetella sp. PMI_491]
MKGHIALVTRLHELYSASPDNYVQFYNSPGCDSASSQSVNYDDWVSFLQRGASKNAKIFIVLLGPSAYASSDDYDCISAADAYDLISHCRTRPSFGGAIFLWRFQHFYDKQFLWRFQHFYDKQFLWRFQHFYDKKFLWCTHNKNCLEPPVRYTTTREASLLEPDSRGR